jgi:phospholipase/carboxylesterase
LLREDSPAENADLGFVHQFVPGTEPGVTLLLLCGTGEDETDFPSLGSQLWPGAALLNLRGKVPENGASRFPRCPEEEVFDIDDLKLRIDELAEFLDVASYRYHFRESKVIAVGYSNGASIAASLILFHPHHLAAAVLFRAMVPFTPAIVRNLSQVNVFIAAGVTDSIVPRKQAKELALMLRAGGADVTIYWHDGGHELGADDLTAAKLWLSEQKWSRSAAGSR